MKNRKVTAYILPSGSIQQIVVVRGQRVTCYAPGNLTYMKIMLAVGTSNMPVEKKFIREEKD